RRKRSKLDVLPGRRIGRRSWARVRVTDNIQYICPDTRVGSIITRQNDASSQLYAHEVEVESRRVSELTPVHSRTERLHANLSNLKSRRWRINVRGAIPSKKTGRVTSPVKPKHVFRAIC